MYLMIELIVIVQIVWVKYTNVKKSNEQDTSLFFSFFFYIYVHWGFDYRLGIDSGINKEPMYDTNFCKHIIQEKTANLNTF